MIEFIFWDNDGVLVDTERLYYQATREVMAEFGYELSEEDFAEFFLVQSKGAWHVLEENGVDEASIKSLREKRNKRYLQLLESDSQAIPGAKETLEALHRKVGMGVVTSSHGEPFDIIHRSTGFKKYFDFVLVREDYAESKPNAEPYLAAIAMAKTNPENCLVIEDSQRGLIAAKSAGLCCWIIPNPLTSKGDFSEADKVLGSISEVPELIYACNR